MIGAIATFVAAVIAQLVAAALELLGQPATFGQVGAVLLFAVILALEHGYLRWRQHHADKRTTLALEVAASAIETATTAYRRAIASDPQTPAAQLQLKRLIRDELQRQITLAARRRHLGDPRT